MYISFFGIIFGLRDELSAEIIEYLSEEVRIIGLEKSPASGFCYIFEHGIIDISAELFSFLVEKILTFSLIIKIGENSSR